MTVEVKVIVDWGVGGSEFLQGLNVPEPCHRPFPSSERDVSFRHYCGASACIPGAACFQVTRITSGELLK